MTKTTSGASPPLVLRDYQREALEIMKNYDGRAGLLVLGTGLGKTAIFTELLKSEVWENDHTGLILSHREELVKQPLTYLKGIPCGIELAARHAHGEKIISASVQSLAGRLNNYNPFEISTIIVDEAHHAAAPTYKKILDYFHSARVFGFTACSRRGDGVGLECAFDDILFERDTLWGIEHGYLCPVDCQQVRLKYDMGSVRIREDTGDFSAADVARVMSGTAAGVVEAYEKYAHGPTIIFAASVDEAKDIAEILNRKAGKRVAATIFGNTKNRAYILEAYQLGAIRVLVNYGVLTEGTDLPMTETVIIARPIARTNIGLYAQMVGRGLRLYPGKLLCTLVDCVGIADVPLCTAATLIGKEPKAPDKDKKEKEKEEMPADETPVLIGEQIPKTWLKSQTEVKIMEKQKAVDMHDVAWLELENGGYVLAIPNVVYRISGPDADGNVFLRRNKKTSHNPMPLQFVCDYVYQDLKQKYSNMRHIWDKEQRRRWDSQPSTPEQAKLIRKLAPAYKMDTKTMTRGDASALINLLLYKPDEASAIVKGDEADGKASS